MASKIKIKRSAVAGKVPLTTDLELSELAVNTNDGRLYTKKDDGTESIVEIGGPDFGSRNVTTTGTSTAASFIPTSSTVPTNGVYLPAANSVALSTNGTGKLFINSSGVIEGYNTQSTGAGIVTGLRLNSARATGGDGTEITFNLDFPGYSALAGIAGVFSGGGNNGHLTFKTVNSGTYAERLRITSTGNVGINTSSPNESLHVNGNARADSFLSQGNFAGQGNLTTADSRSGFTGLGPSSVASPGDFYGGYGYFFGATHNTRPGDIEFGTGLNTAGSIQFKINGTERFRCDNSGRLLVGTSSAYVGYGGSSDNKLQIAGTLYSNAAVSAFVFANTDYGSNINLGLSRNPTIGSHTVVNNGDGLGQITFNGSDGTTFKSAAIIDCRVDGTPGANNMPGRLSFSTTALGSSSPTERMRISQDGTTYTRGSTSVFSFASNAGAGTTNWLQLGGHSAASITGYTISYAVYTNGNVVNTNGSYTAISDAKLKENIVDASSQWDDLKAIQIRNWNFKEETGHETHRQIGPIAQELEQVCPGLVFETPDRDAEGNDLGTVTKGVNQSVLYMKAVKALQEAMERIEALEASNTDLLARVSALESA